MRFSRALRVFAAVSLSVLALSSCAAIPTSSSVEEGRVQEDNTEQDVHYFPAGPNNNATREEIVQGFLDAGTGTQNGYSTARQYLTGSATENWSPDARVIITTGQASMKSTGQNRIEVSVPVSGEVDKHGLYSETMSKSNENLSFELQQVNGQWRISQAPDGVIMQKQAFSDLYAQQTLTFFDGARRFTTPDLRWLPKSDGVPTRVVEELLAGPAEWMRPGSAVATAFPSGTELISPVVVENGTAIVNLNDAASSSASANDLSLMRLQLETSLRDVTSIASAEIRVNGSKLDVQLPPRDAVITAADVSSMPLVQKTTDFGYLNTNQLVQPDGAANVASEIRKLEPIRGAVSASRKTAALLTTTGAFAMKFDDDSATLVDTRPGQVEPALDNWDWVWTQSTTDTGLYVTHIGDYSVHQVELPDSVAANFISHQVSRDGTRLAVLFSSSEGVKLAIMPIIRDNGDPVELGMPYVVSMPGAGDKASDLAWIDANSVAMLVNTADGSTSVRVYRVGGELTSMGSIPSAAQVAGSNTLAGMRIVDRQGIVYAPRGSRWQASEVVITFLYAQV